MRCSAAVPAACLRPLAPALAAAALIAPALAAQDTIVRMCRPTNPPQCTPALPGQASPGLEPPGQAPPAPPRAGAEGEKPYFEFMADPPARLRPDSPRPAYPPSLRDAGVRGEVLAQFVVDSTGRVDARSFKVLRATHDQFVTSVRASLDSLRYSPARVQGRAVRQLVQESFLFGAPRER